MTSRPPSRWWKCGYCDRPAVLVHGDDIYPHRPDLHQKRFWKCPGDCDAYVGCHPGTNMPLGRLANAELRRAKQKVHKVLDPLWRSGSMKRSDAYALLAERLGISKGNCHVGMFDVPTCEAAVAALRMKTAHAKLAV